MVFGPAIEFKHKLKRKKKSIDDGWDGVCGRLILKNVKVVNTKK